MTTKKIGALWKKKSKDGKSYLSGNIELINGIVQRVAVFTNDKKTNPKQPDYSIVLSQPNPEQPKQAEQSAPKSEDLDEF